MRKAAVIVNGRYAGLLCENDDRNYEFRYSSKYIADADTEPISVRLPKNRGTFRSNNLFPFFFSLLSEGDNRKAQCQALKIDENDYFGLLLATASHDTIGNVTIQEIR
ncbi:MAG: HipA N-terminal domain-containing protein [Bacteroidales bacterium]|nr:HipA N-terminal domain-containing protein [Bacteroidales bacterium]